MLVQGWLTIALWMSFGLLLEGFLGFKIPTYLQDEQRREMFRLAHSHGTLLGLVCVAAALVIQRLKVSPPSLALFSLRTGVVIMPLGFLLAGIWHSETDPGIAIWSVPVAALLVIFGVVSLSLACWKNDENT